MSLKQVAINSAIVFGILLLAFLLWIFREAVVLFVFSLAVAAATRPFVESLVIHRVPRALAIILVYALFLGALIAIFWAIGNAFMDEIQSLSNNLAVTYDQIWNTWPGGSQVQKFIIRQLPAPAELYQGLTAEQASSTVSGLMGLTLTSASFIGHFFTVLMLSIYWSIDRVHFERVWLSLLPVNSRAQARDIWRNIEHDFGAYVRSEIMQSILAGLLLGIGLAALGVPYPILLALFGALAWLIPWLGGILAVLPIALAGLSQSPGLAILASAYALGVLFFLEFYVEPRFIHRRQQRFSSLLSILLIIALIQPFGLMGLLVAPPLAAAIELIFRYNLRTRPLPESLQTAEQISVLRGRIIQMRELLRHTTETVEPQTNSLLDRLETLVDQSEQALRQQDTAPPPPRRRASDQLPIARAKRP